MACLHSLAGFSVNTFSLEICISSLISFLGFSLFFFWNFFFLYVGPLDQTSTLLSLFSCFLFLSLFALLDEKIS